jgi:hypothetical protein
MRKRIWLAIALMAITSAAAGTPAVPTQPTEFDAEVVVDVGPEGQVLGVVPNRSVPGAVAAVLQTRLVQWQFEPPMFQAKPAQMRLLLKLRLVLVPTGAGGYGIRVVAANAPWIEIPQMSFSRPPKSETVVYLLTNRTDGTQEVELVQPQKPPRGFTALDHAARLNIARIPHTRVMVDGQAVSCRALFSMRFQFEGPIPEESAEVHALRKSIDDECPTTKLLSNVEGSLL